MRLLRYLGIGVLAILVVGLAVPYIDANMYRERIERALEQSLDRKVTAGKVRFNLLTGPGFTVEDVTIGEDPSIGIEPIAWVEKMDARVRLATLWTGNLSFSTLRLENPTVNLSKGDNGAWNFQSLMRAAAARAASSAHFPAILVRSGRINFKFGDYKAIFYLSDADLDVIPLGPDRLDVRFSGQPARTDHTEDNFGRLLGRGVWGRSADGNGEIDANVELERSGISDLARLVGGHSIGVHGIAASRVHISGPSDKLRMSGQLRLEDIHRWDLIPPKSGGWDLKFKGTANLAAEQLALETAGDDPAVPLRVRFEASDYLKDPKWRAALELKDAPVAPFVEVARHMGAQIPNGLAADGKVAGTIGYSFPGGVEGKLTIHDASVSVAKASPWSVRSAEISVDGDGVEVGPVVVTLASGEAAEVKGAWENASGSLTVNVSTRGMSVAELRGASEPLLGPALVPVLQGCRQGTWRGALNYEQDAAGSAWSGTFELRGARVEVDGLSEPVRIESAAVDVNGPRVAIRQLKASAGPVSFTGEYRHERAGRPDRLKLDIREAGIGALEKLFLPSLKRDSGLLARLRIRTPEVPEWLQSRTIDAAVKIEKLTVGEQAWAVGKLHLVWDGATVKLTTLEASADDAQVSGQATINLAGAQPRYRIEGKVDSLDYHGGALSLDAKGETRGTGMDFLANGRGSGTFSADSVTFPPEAEFRAITGNFELTAGGRLKLTTVQAAQGADAYAGAGGTQADGRTVLELTGAKRVVRLAVAK